MIVTPMNTTAARREGDDDVARHREAVRDQPDQVAEQDEAGTA